MRDLKDGWSHEASPFHKGEVTLQKQVGVFDRMDKFARRMIRSFMPDQHRTFFENQPLLYLGYVDEGGWPVATLLHGLPGFLQSPDAQTLRVNALPSEFDPFASHIRKGVQVGLLGLEMHTRRRNRLNATIMDIDGDGFTVTVDQSFGNCPQYIKTRSVDFSPRPQVEELSAVNFESLGEDAKHLIEAAETFFVASHSSGHQEAAADGVDMSHRGGRSGFVKVDGNTLTIPDFSGNFYFNTLGNFVINPKAGLLFIDYEMGHMLQLSGTVELIMEGAEVDLFKGAERLWKLHVNHGRWLYHAIPYRWSAGEEWMNLSETSIWSEVTPG